MAHQSVTGFSGVLFSRVSQILGNRHGNDNHICQNCSNSTGEIVWFANDVTLNDMGEISRILSNTKHNKAHTLF